MTLKEMKQKYRALIAALNVETPTQGADTSTQTPEAAALSAETTFPQDPIREHNVINQVMTELCCIKKLPRCISLPVSAGERITLDRLAQVCGSDIFQLGQVEGPSHIRRAEGTVLDFLESGTAQIDCWVYPEPITPTTPDSYEFELSPQVLEIMPYGIAADLLKNDAAANYGRSYESRYETLVSRLAQSCTAGSLVVSGGLAV